MMINDEITFFKYYFKYHIFYLLFYSFLTVAVVVNQGKRRLKCNFTCRTSPKPGLQHKAKVTSALCLCNWDIIYWFFLFFSFLPRRCFNFISICWNGVYMACIHVVYIHCLRHTTWVAGQWLLFFSVFPVSISWELTTEHHFHALWHAFVTTVLVLP